MPKKQRSQRLQVYEAEPAVRRPSPMNGVDTPDSINPSDHNHFYHTPPDSGIGLGQRRKSWQDLVAESETSTISEVSFMNSSFGGDLPTMGNRRQSWMNLMESDENLHRHSRLPQVSSNPQGASGKIGFVSVTDSGKLRSEKNGNGKQRKDSTNSKASTLQSEFILVPKAYSAEALPSKDPNLGNDDWANAPGASERPCQCPCSAKTFLISLIAIAITLTATVVIALIARKGSGLPDVYRFKWSGEGGKQNILTLVITSEDQAIFHIVGALPFQSTKTTIDFNTGKVVSVDTVIPNFCFARHLNKSAIPSQEALMEGAENALEIENDRKAEWERDWHWLKEDLAGRFKEEVLSSVMTECKAADKLKWLRKTFESNKEARCTGCSEVCLPEFAVETAGGARELRISGAICFWLLVPEWAEAVEKYQNEIKPKPTGSWIQIQYSTTRTPKSTAATTSTTLPSTVTDNDGWIVANPNGNS